MKVLFCRSHTVLSWLIRLFTWSDWSHVVLVDPDGTRTVEARWPRVTESTLLAALAEYSVTRSVEMPCAAPGAALAWARSQVGKPYDWRAIFGFILHREWSDDSRWFCSELVAAAFQEGGAPIFRADAINRVTPQMLWMLPGQDR